MSLRDQLIERVASRLHGVALMLSFSQQRALATEIVDQEILPSLRVADVERGTTTSDDGGVW